jgi:membrane protein DedA with SNARE-associated domain
MTHNHFFAYLLVFLLMFVEGPIVAYISAFIAALGYFNVWILLILFILGNQIPDLILFRIGGLLRKKNIERLFSYFKLTRKRLYWLEKNIKKHYIKTLILFKSIPPFPIPGILLSGFLRVSTKKFFWADLVYNVFYATIFIYVGYYSGLAANISLKYFKLSELLLPTAVVLVLLLYLLLRWASEKVVQNIED